jgi:multidrug efflux pump subunit AcrA (membrane-fusion protein)
MEKKGPGMKGFDKTGKTAVLLGLGMIILALIAGCDRFGGKDSAAGAEKPAAGEGEGVTVFAVSTVKAVKGQIRDYIELNGDVTAGTRVDTYPDAAGKLSRLYVEVGQRVRKGQVIAEVDPSRPGMQFALSPVKAAISGTVTNIPVQVGATVSQQVPIVQISDMRDLEVRVHVAEKFISRMQVGLPAEMSFDAYPGKIFYGKIKELSPVVDPQSRTLEVKIGLSDGTELLKAGMFGEVKLVTMEKDGVVKIPSDCVVNLFGEEFVFLVERSGDGAEGIARRVKVTRGIEIDQKLEITSGLEPGDEVVYRGQTLLEDGSKVRVVETVQPLSGDDELE